MKELTIGFWESAKLIWAEIATVGIEGAGAGICLLFVFFLLRLRRNPSPEGELLKN